MEGLEVDVRIVEPEYAQPYRTFLNDILSLGDVIGREKYGEEKWHKMLYPSEEKLRIKNPPRSYGSRLEIDAATYSWDDLQRNKVLQPIGKFDEDDPIKYYLNGVALTANGLIETADGNLVFHYKRGGAKQGSIHTFGGYVTKEDINIGGIREAVLRELEEKEEVGLKREEMKATALFGTPNKKPSILWDFGTGAIYCIVKTSLSSNEIQERVNSIPEKGESLVKNLYVIPLDNIKNLQTEKNVHPQTKQVVPTIIEMYE
ncbi:MAG: hypothetical protein AABX73_00825 [Nanoarchaeota archaeon]